MDIVTILPSTHNHNPFIDLTAQSIRLEGRTVVPDEEILADELSCYKRYIILNWYDEFQKMRKPLTVRGMVHIAANRVKRVEQLRRSGVRIVTVIHNNRPHNRLSFATAFLSRNLRRFLCWRSDAIVGLCRATEARLQETVHGWDRLGMGEKFHVVPHPNYSGSYDDSDLRRLDAFGFGNRFTFLLTGRLRTYKNLELTLALARKFEDEGLDARFVMAGFCGEPQYLRALKSAAPGNVEIIDGFLSEDDMARYVRSCDALLLPYDKSTLNSGVCLLAFTMARTVVCPDIGTLEDIPRDLAYTYAYKDEQDHPSRLYEAARDAYEGRLRDPVGFAAKGIALRGIVLERNSIESVGRAWSEVFDDIERRRARER